MVYLRVSRHIGSLRYLVFSIVENRMTKNCRLRKVDVLKTSKYLVCDQMN
jgi:hypothetical protein